MLVKLKISAKEMLNKCYKQFWNVRLYVKKLQIDLLKKDFAKMIDDVDSETYM